MRVCDKCGKKAAETFEFDAMVVDLCPSHAAELKTWLYGQMTPPTEQRVKTDSSTTLTLKGRSNAK